MLGAYACGLALWFAKIAALLSIGYRRILLERENEILDERLNVTTLASSALHEDNVFDKQQLMSGCYPRYFHARTIQQT